MWLFVIVLTILLMLYLNHWSRRLAIKRWRKALQLDKHQAVYVQLFAETDGFTLSRHARSASDAMEYVYGEIDFISFIALLSLVKPNKNTVFYDLGSGTGTAVLACAMVFNIAQSNGIERFPLLHNAACQQKKSLSRLSGYEKTAQKIQFINADFLTVNLNKATLVFINSTGFFGETWAAISAQLEQATRCTTVITTSKPLKSTVYIVIRITLVEMSWGTVNAFIHQRIRKTIDII